MSESEACRRSVACVAEFVPVSRKKAARPRAIAADEGDGNGLMARLIDRTFENPATSGGLLVMALTAGAIITNATMLQGARHPDPLFGVTVADPPLPVAAASAPVGSQLADPVNAMAPIAAGDMPFPRPSPRRALAAAAAPAPAATPGIADLLAPRAEPTPPLPIPEPPQRSQQEMLLIEIQRELARVGLYNGAIDGLTGPRTSAAIRAFQTAAGLPASGEPSLELLGAIRQPLPTTAVQPAVTRTADGLAEAAALSRRERERAELIAAERRRHDEARLRENVKIVQLALNRIGYGPLPTEGVDDGETRDAIRRFELDNGMPITGTASDALISRLISIGAVKPG